MTVRAPTFKEVLGAKWPKAGYLLPDGRRVVDMRTPGQRAGIAMGVHACLDDGSCQSGRYSDGRFRLKRRAASSHDEGSQ